MKENENLRLIEKLTYLNSRERKQAFNSFKSLCLYRQVQLSGKILDQYYKLKIKHKNNIALLASMLIVMSKWKKEQKLLNAKNSNMSLDYISIEDTIQETENLGSEKYERIVTLLPIINKLRESRKSWRIIEKYLQKKHKFDVSHTYLAKKSKELNNVTS